MLYMLVRMDSALSIEKTYDSLTKSFIENLYLPVTFYSMYHDIHCTCVYVRPILRLKSNNKCTNAEKSYESAISIE